MKAEIKIAGAGISGLTAAINLAKADYPVKVYEAGNHPAAPRKGDHQHLENWTTEEDVLDWLQELNVPPDFPYQPAHSMHILAPGQQELTLASDRPLFYSVRRGRPEDSIDRFLAEKARAKGVTIEYGRTKVKKEADIIATGPETGFTAGKGYLFPVKDNSQRQEDQIYVSFDNKIANRGYAYLTIINGQGTVLVGDFEPNKNPGGLQQFKGKMERKLDLIIEDKELFGGYIAIPSLSYLNSDSEQVKVGAAAGFQDALAGFGMRYAFLSGYLAAQSIIKNKDYKQLCREQIGPGVKAGLANRYLYDKLNNWAYSWLIWANQSKLIRNLLLGSHDLIQILKKRYRPSLLKRGLYLLAKRKYGLAKQ